MTYLIWISGKWKKWIWTICKRCFICQYYLWGPIVHICYMLTYWWIMRYRTWTSLKKKVIHWQRIALGRMCPKTLSPQRLHTLWLPWGLTVFLYHLNASMHVWVNSSRLCLPKNLRREGCPMLDSNVRKFRFLFCKESDSEKAVDYYIGSLFNSKIP